MLTKIFGIAMAMAMGVVLVALGALIPTAPPREKMTAASPRIDQGTVLATRN